MSIPGRLNLHRSDYVRAERTQVTILRNEIVAAQCLGDVVGQARRQPEQRIGVIVGIEHAAAGLYHRPLRGRPDHAQRAARSCSCRCRRSPRVAALAAYEQRGVVESGLLGREALLRRRNLAVIDAGHLLLRVVHRRGQLITQADVDCHARTRWKSSWIYKD